MINNTKYLGNKTNQLANNIHPHIFIFTSADLLWELLNIISGYAPDIYKPKEEREIFYNQLHNIINTVNPQEKITIMGDLNARIGDNELNEKDSNDNGNLLKYFCGVNKLKINHTFFVHHMR